MYLQMALDSALHIHQCPSAAPASCPLKLKYLLLQEPKQKKEVLIKEVITSQQAAISFHRKRSQSHQYRQSLALFL